MASGEERPQPLHLFVRQPVEVNDGHSPHLESLNGAATEASIRTMGLTLDGKLARINPLWHCSTIGKVHPFGESHNIAELSCECGRPRLRVGATGCVWEDQR